MNADFEGFTQRLERFSVDLATRYIRADDKLTRVERFSPWVD
jgi:hypothetical protein